MAGIIVLFVSVIILFFLIQKPVEKSNSDEIIKELEKINENLRKTENEKEFKGEQVIDEETLKAFQEQLRQSQKSIFDNGVEADASSSEKAIEFAENSQEFMDLNASNPSFNVFFISKKEVQSLKEQRNYAKSFPVKDLYQVNITFNGSTFIAFIDLNENKMLFFTRAVELRVG